MAKPVKLFYIYVLTGYTVKILRIILIHCLFYFNDLFAFDVNLALDKNAFVYEKYNFCIVDVIDARINKEVPSGFFYQGLLNKKHTVGNDSLSKSLVRYLNKHTKPFYESTKIILVINQLNITEIVSNNIDDFEFTIGFDYYRVTDNSAKLEYSQYLRYYKGAGLNKENAINKGFSETFAAAFLQFKNQLMYYKPPVFTPVNITDLYNKLTEPINPSSTSQITDGVYFNIAQLLKNAPALVSGYTVKDSALFSAQPAVIDSKTYLVKKAFAIVKSGQLFLHLSDGIYLPATVESDGTISLKDLYYQKKKNIFNNSAITGLKGYFSLLAIASDIANLAEKGELVKIKLDTQTGTLTL
jgi:hypothetical protein